MAIQLKGSDEVMVVQSVVSSSKILVLRGAFDTPMRRSAGSDDEINILGSVDDLVCAPNACDIDNITGAGVGANYSDCDGKRSGMLCTAACVEGYTATQADLLLVCDGEGHFQSDASCQANSCDIDNIVNAVAYANYSSCRGKATGEVCTPVCVPGSEPVTSASQPIHLVCDTDGDFTDSITLTGAVVANVARLNASLSHIPDTVLSSTAGCHHPSPYITWLSYLNLLNLALQPTCVSISVCPPPSLFLCLLVHLA